MGIEPIPREERNLRGLDFFLLWAGAAISLAEIWAGGLIVPLGLGIGFWAILVGHMIGNTPFALAGVVGSRWGIPAMVAVRPAFGVRGSYLAAALNVIQLAGWTAVMLMVCASAADAISRNYGYSNVPLWILLGGCITTAWALAGHRAWKWLQRISVFALLFLCLMMTYVIFRYYGWAALSSRPKDNGLGMMAAIDLVIAMPVSWLPLVSDYSRFARDSKSCFWGTWIGYLIISSWMYVLGLAASLAARTSDPSGAMMDVLFLHGWAVPALIIILFSTVTTTFLDIYSTAISALNLFPRLGEAKGTIAGGVLGTAVALLFPALLEYEHFLLLIGAMFCPLFGIVLIDYFLLRKGTIDTGALFLEGGPYWFTRGVNLKALFAWTVGVVVYLGFSPSLTEKVFGMTAAFPWSIGSSLPSMILAALVYCVLESATTTGKRRLA
jgi:nucleobase:cation symporter-1, NCS1 family